MDRRTFIGSVAGGRLVVPVATRVQKSPIPVIGYLGTTSPATSNPHALAGFGRRGMSSARTWRLNFAGRRPLRSTAPAGRRSGHASGGNPSHGRRRFGAGRQGGDIYNSDRLFGGPRARRACLVVSLGRHGGNATGVSIVDVELAAKRLELLHELVPKATAIALLMNPDSSTGNAAARETQEAARVACATIQAQSTGLSADISGQYR
jgi:ABC transporter substrate binding protein